MDPAAHLSTAGGTDLAQPRDSPGTPVRALVADLADAVRRAQEGDEDAFRVLYRDLQPRFLRYLRVIVGDDADDVASETWLHIARGLTSFRGDSDGFRGWTATIARNRATGVQQAMDSTVLRQLVIGNPQFNSLVATVQGQANVADYCGLLLRVAKLPSPASLVKLPASVLSALPAGVVSKIPALALSAVPAIDLSRLPAAFLARLSGPALAGLPASVLAKFPAGVLASMHAGVLAGLHASVLSGLPAGTLTALLPRLPGATLAQLPAGTLAGALRGLPSKSAAAILAKLPTGSLTRVLPELPASLVSGLPRSLLAGLPPSLLSQLAPT